MKNHEALPQLKCYNHSIEDNLFASKGTFATFILLSKQIEVDSLGVQVPYCNDVDKIIFPNALLNIL